jgi:hypothetical protein
VSLPAADIAAIIAAHPDKATATLPTLATLDGIFTAPSRSASVFNASVNGTDPLFVIAETDRTTHGLDIGSYLTIAALDYQIVDLDRRNDGFSGLMLQRSQL